MTQLSQFMQSVSGNARKMTAMAAVGLLAVMAVPNDASAFDSSGRDRRVVVETQQDAWAMAERVGDQLGGMKMFSDALRGTLYSNVPGHQKAKNIAIAYAFQLRQAAHPELENTDDYLAAVPNDPEISQGIRELVDVVNARKMELYRMSAVLMKIEHAYAREDVATVQVLANQLSQLADRAQEELAVDDYPASYGSGTSARAY